MVEPPSLTVVGSGTVVPQADRVCSGYFVESADIRLLLDCGPGVVHHLARFGLPWSGMTHLALSHFHTDHIADIPALITAMRHGLSEPRAAPLTVIGPVGTSALFQRMAAAFGDYLVRPGFPLLVHELGTGGALELGAGARITAHATSHTDRSVGYRVDLGRASVGYSGDTGHDEALAAFFQDVDLLVLECSLPDEEAMSSHLTPTRAAAMAVISRPKQLLLTHMYPQLDSNNLPSLLRSAGWDGPVRVAHDGLRLTVGHTPEAGE